MSWRVLPVAVCTTAVVLTFAALSRAPYTPPGADAAVLRFSWRMNVAAREDCRPRTQQELDALPAHMRTPEVCTADRATYSLVIRIDATEQDTIDVVRGGVKGDRPLFVLEERRLRPGRHRVEVGLHRVTDTSDRDGRHVEGRSRGDELLASLDTVLDLEAGAVQLVTLGGESRNLTVVSSPRR